MATTLLASVLVLAAPAPVLAQAPPPTCDAARAQLAALDAQALALGNSLKGLDPRPLADGPQVEAITAQIGQVNNQRKALVPVIKAACGATQPPPVSAPATPARAIPTPATIGPEPPSRLGLLFELYRDPSLSPAEHKLVWQLISEIEASPDVTPDLVLLTDLSTLRDPNASLAAKGATVLTVLAGGFVAGKLTSAVLARIGARFGAQVARHIDLLHVGLKTGNKALVKQYLQFMLGKLPLRLAYSVPSVSARREFIGQWLKSQTRMGGAVQSHIDALGRVDRVLWGKVSGPPSEYGRKIVDRMLKYPGTNVKNVSGALEVRLPPGKGFNARGEIVDVGSYQPYPGRSGRGIPFNSANYESGIGFRIINDRFDTVLNAQLRDRTLAPLPR